MNTLETPVQYQHCAVLVQVAFAEEALDIDTLEGPVKCKAGDAIVTGVHGERWPIERLRFVGTYEAADGVVMFQAGFYRRKPTVVTARQLLAPMTIELSGARGALAAKAGDWLIHGGEGDQWIVADVIFQKTYTLNHTLNRALKPEIAQK